MVRRSRRHRPFPDGSRLPERRIDLNEALWPRGRREPVSRTGQAPGLHVDRATGNPRRSARTIPGAAPEPPLACRRRDRHRGHGQACREGGIGRIAFASAAERRREQPRRSGLTGRGVIRAVPGRQLRRRADEHEAAEPAVIRADQSAQLPAAVLHRALRMLIPQERRQDMPFAPVPDRLQEKAREGAGALRNAAGGGYGIVRYLRTPRDPGAAAPAAPSPSARKSSRPPEGATEARGRARKEACCGSRNSRSRRLDCGTNRKL